MPKISLTESQLINVVKIIITENRDMLIVESIILSENNVDKFKEILRSGLVTAAVVASLLSSTFINAQEKSQIKQLAVQNGIETVPNNTVGGNIQNNINSVGIGIGKTKDEAKKIAINNAVGNIGENNKQMLGDKDYSISNFKIIDEQYKENADGTSKCQMQCTMTATY